MSVRAAAPRRQSTAEVLVVDGHPLRIGAWRGSERVGYLAPLGDGRLSSPGTVRQAMGRLAARGFEEVVTAAVPEPDTDAFLACGFQPHERLHLLAHPLTGVPPVRWRATRPARGRDRRAVLDVDHRAFEPFWRLDAEGLDDAVSATPASRFRITTARTSAVPPSPDLANGATRDPNRSGVTGYAVFGLAGRRGYLQRLAVDPDVRRQGIATRLVHDGLGWLIRRGATSALVNTQERNETALQLYLRLGFVREPYKLVVLWSPLRRTAQPTAST